MRSRLLSGVAGLFLTAVAVGIEALHFHKILTHPAGSGTSVDGAMEGFVALAVLPFAMLLLVGLIPKTGSAKALRAIAIAGAVGAILCAIAYRQYGHATGGFLMVGYLGQWLVALRVCWQQLGSGRWKL
jgi:hypothetical protein